MHELSIVESIVKHAKNAAEANGFERISGVTVMIGEVSGIIPFYLVDYWNWYRNKLDLLKGSELTVETIPAVTWCDACKSEYETVKYGKTCPNCGSGETWLLRGNEVFVKEIAVEDPEWDPDAEPEWDDVDEDEEES